VMTFEGRISGIARRDARCSQLISRRPLLARPVSFAIVVRHSSKLKMQRSQSSP